MFANLLNRLKEELAYQRDLAEVQAMDDRQLADIGVSRIDLAGALRADRRRTEPTRAETVASDDSARSNATRLAA